MKSQFIDVFRLCSTITALIIVRHVLHRVSMTTIIELAKTIPRLVDWHFVTERVFSNRISFTILCPVVSAITIISWPIFSFWSTPIFKQWANRNKCITVHNLYTVNIYLHTARKGHWVTRWHKLWHCEAFPDVWPPQPYILEWKLLIYTDLSNYQIFDL